ncbi:hypothetical protein FS749_010568 [Ceratobasidium sp. UAMH 11750]|nr:hypothetical protein FS749_010568 [Ceratobasidium sp. UAMH 11750]
MKHGKHGFSVDAAFGQMYELISKLQHDITWSHTILGKSLQAQADMWEQELRLWATQENSDNQQTQEIGMSATSGIPYSHWLRQAMLHELEDAGSPAEEDVDFALAELQQNCTLTKEQGLRDICNQMLGGDVMQLEVPEVQQEPSDNEEPEMLPKMGSSHPEGGGKASAKPKKKHKTTRKGTQDSPMQDEEGGLVCSVCSVDA